jgi:hypothetical protein
MRATLDRALGGFRSKALSCSIGLNWRNRAAVKAALRPRPRPLHASYLARLIRHGLLLPDQGRPLLGPTSTRQTEQFLRNARSDIPAAVVAMRQYWMPIRYPRAR